MKLIDLKGFIDKGDLQIINHKSGETLRINNKRIDITLNQNEVVTFYKQSFKFMYNNIELFTTYGEWIVDNIYKVNNNLCVDIFNN
ncbi:uncharacterized protein CBO05P1_223 [Clostridium botulinum B str. Osaka05]|uniref:Uncharacterized protein n=1 Tax=Clostridium botulinum B str. Osaka05 TaxID=1407017 RepID=A0A060N509_CLOBO|nr:hypothetical protein [Clostridium botulinum]BAO04942.1 uncharacterized protein CBO05P1_223 [Clostridium botulinum B str. Osaka05]